MSKKAGIIFFTLLIFMYMPQLKAEEDSLNSKEIKKQFEQVNSEKTYKTQKGRIETFSDRYIVSPGDKLNVSVLGESEIEQKSLLVKCDGYVNIHPVGEIRVGGFNVDEVKKIISAKLGKYFVEPVVSVQISSLHIPKIYIYGAVQNPGLYQHYCKGSLSEERHSLPPTLAGVIAEAGGIKYNADLENIQVVNQKSKQKKIYNLLSLIKKGDPRQDIYLGSGDRVYIPHKTSCLLSDKDFLLISASSIAPKHFPVRVRGAVKEPGIHFLNTRSPGINTAITSSSGFTFNAKTEEVKIRRIAPNGKISTFVVNPSENDVVLRPNDIIDVYDKRTGLLSKGYRFFMTLVSAAGGSASFLFIE